MWFKNIASKKILRWYDPIFLNIMPQVVASLAKILLNSCSIVRVEGSDFPGTCIYASWHQRMSFFARYLSKKRLIIMISQSRDGEYGARIAKFLGFEYVRGSSTRGGLSALKRMVSYLRSGRSVGILVDGPLGPPRIVKKGAIMISSMSQVPIVPIVWSCSRFWVLNSWDRYMIPKPFSKVVIKYGEPIFVPYKAKDEEIELYRKRLQECLNRDTDWCDRFFGVDVPCKREG